MDHQAFMDQIGYTIENQNLEFRLKPWLNDLGGPDSELVKIIDRYKPYIESQKPRLLKQAEKFSDLMIADTYAVFPDDDLFLRRLCQVLLYLMKNPLIDEKCTVCSYGPEMDLTNNGIPICVLTMGYINVNRAIIRPMFYDAIYELPGVSGFSFTPSSRLDLNFTEEQAIPRYCFLLPPHLRDRLHKTYWVDPKADPRIPRSRYIKDGETVRFSYSKFLLVTKDNHASRIQNAYRAYKRKKMAAYLAPITSEIKEASYGFRFGYHYLQAKNSFEKLKLQ